jgi:hypothetical protein
LTSFHLSYDNRFSVLLAVESLGIRNEVSVSEALCDRIEASVCVYIAEGSSGFVAGNAAPALRSLALRLTQEDPSVVEIRDLITALPPTAVEQIESRALRLADQVPACASLGSDLLGWSKITPAKHLIPLLRLCVVEGGAMVRGQDRPTGRQSAPHFEPIVLGRGRGVPGLTKLEGGRPTDDLEVRLIAHLAVDWLKSTGVRPEPSRDGLFGFSKLVHDVFGWLDIEKKAPHCLKQYWAMTKVKRPFLW